MKSTTMIVLQADSDKVLCDGYTKTSLGGRITAPEGTDLSVWAEMSEAEADALILANTPEEEVTEDELEAQ